MFTFFLNFFLYMSVAIAFVVIMRITLNILKL